jgi:exodeoxyribonuclease-3
VKIITWNVNSIRSRLERALALLERHQPDVLCLQETKVQDEIFPRADFESAGYHVELHGQKTYNGVALISKEPAEDVARGFPGDGEDAQARLIAGTFAGVRVIDVYVPNGQDVESEKFPYKLGWLKQLHDEIAAAHTPDDPVVLLGDFNIAPDERDLYDPEAFRGRIHFHPKEHEALARLSAWGFEDLFRAHHEEAGFYSWWDYRQLGFPKNRGLRIDLVLGTPPMRARCTGCEIDREERKGKKPSDHAPVIAEFRD